MPVVNGAVVINKVMPVMNGAVVISMKESSL